MYKRTGVPSNNILFHLYMRVYPSDTCHSFDKHKITKSTLMTIMDIRWQFT
jgi:hypothetical protein